MTAHDHLRALICTSTDEGVRCVRRWLHEDGHLGRSADGGWRAWVTTGPNAYYEPHELQPGWIERAIQEQEEAA